MNDGFTETVMVNDQECDYDPERQIALVYCNDCSERNEVTVYVEDGEVVFQGFVCDKCGAWNPPGD